MARFIETVFEEGVQSTLYGLQGSGKTNLAVVFMEQAVAYGMHVYTIINFFKYDQIGLAIKKGKLAKIRGHIYRKKPEEIHIITSLSELLVGLLTTENNLVVLDESGLFGSSTEATSKKVRMLKQLAFVIRHLNASLMLIAQSKKSLVPDLRETLTTYEMRVKQIGRERMFTVAIAMPFKNEFGEEIIDFIDVDEYWGIPPASFPFDSKFLPKFTFDLDLTEALDRLGPYNSIEVMEVGRGIIEGMMKEKEKKKSSYHGGTSKKDAIMSEFINGTKLTLKGLAKKYKTSYHNVANIHSKYLQEFG